MVLLVGAVYTFTRDTMAVFETEELLARCGEVDLTGDPTDPQLPARPAGQIGREVLNATHEDGAGSETLAGYDWYIAEQSESVLKLWGEAPPRESEEVRRYASAEFTRDGDRWKVQSTGSCNIETYVPEFRSLSWELVRVPDEETTELDVLVDFTGCSEKDLEKEDLGMVFDGRGDRVILTILLSQDRPAEFCPAVPGPPERITVNLPEPVGDRALYDGSVTPAVRPDPAQLYNAYFEGRY